MTGGMVATSLVFFPAAPFFLFMHGKDISIPKGTEVTAYVSGDMKLDIAKFQPAAPAPVIASNTAYPTQAHLQISSTPDGADIEVDGNFAGNTPSDIDVAAGDHVITMKKSGYKDWTKNMKISAGSNIHIKPELEKAAGQRQQSRLTRITAIHGQELFRRYDASVQWGFRTLSFLPALTG